MDSASGRGTRINPRGSLDTIAYDNRCICLNILNWSTAVEVFSTDDIRATGSV